MNTPKRLTLLLAGVLAGGDDLALQVGVGFPQRTPRGRDILAACGQLKSESVKLRARDRSPVEPAEGPAISPIGHVPAKA